MFWNILQRYAYSSVFIVDTSYLRVEILAICGIIPTFVSFEEFIV